MFKKENSLAIKYPLMVNEWHPSKNGLLNPLEISATSHLKVWWLCGEGHEWQATIANRTTKNSGCPYCSGRKVIIGKTDLATCFPQIAAEWHPTKNGSLSPLEIGANSHLKVWWICSRGHEWQATINRRVGGSGCPYCAGTSVLAGFNDLQTVNPQLASEWHPVKNGELKPTMVSRGSKTVIWWLGKCGHEWQAMVTVRDNGHGCPFCSGKKILPGFNDLKTVNPHLASEWHPTKNEGLTPESVFAGTEKKVWWLGKCGHEWQASPKSRSRGNGCPICAKRSQSSFPEQAIYYYVKKLFPNAINRYTEIFKRMEIDIYIPSSCVGIEYDGKAFHNSAAALAKEKQKYEICKENGIKLIRIREFENQSNEICDKAFIIPHRYTFSDLDRTITELLQFISFGNSVDINVERDEWKIKEEYYALLKENSLLYVRADLAAEWHPTKNGTIKPNMISKSSNDKVWWLGKCGHEWQATVGSRYQGNKCPYCSGKKLLVGFNDLQTVNPQLALEWHPTKNGDLTPEMVQEKSGKKVWWLGKCGHEWQAQIRHRSEGHGCPYCWGRVPVSGKNDLQSVYPEVAKLWHPTKNGDLNPSRVTKGSEKKVWWLGKCGHEWQRTVKLMVKASGCPYCTGVAVLKGFNDLSTKRPEIAAEWNYKKNKELTPDMFSEKSGKKVWWICSEGHEWQTCICTRSNGSGCPICRRKKHSTTDSSSSNAI